jgi:hypothetical protein
MAVKLVPVDHDPFAKRGKSKEQAVKDLIKSLSESDDEVVVQLRLLNTRLAKLLERPLPKVPAPVAHVAASAASKVTVPAPQVSVMAPEVDLSAIVAAIRSIPSPSAVDFAPLIAAVNKNTAAVEALCRDVRASGGKPRSRRRTVRMGRDPHGNLTAVIDELGDDVAKH